jgi:hypothetical protein
MIDAQLALSEQQTPPSAQDESAAPTRPHNTICKLWAKATQIRGAVAMRRGQSDGKVLDMQAYVDGLVERARFLLALQSSKLASYPIRTPTSLSPTEIQAALATASDASELPSMPPLPPGMKRTPSAVARHAARSKRWAKVKAFTRTIRFTLQAVWKLRRFISYSLGPQLHGEPDVTGLISNFLQDTSVKLPVLTEALNAQRVRFMHVCCVELPGV